GFHFSGSCSNQNCFAEDVPPDFCTTSSFTLTIPRSTIPKLSAADPDKSTTRPGTSGPRSLMRTTTERPLLTLVTRSRVPNGSVGCAAVIAWVLNLSPLAAHSSSGEKLATP